VAKGRPLGLWVANAVNVSVTKGAEGRGTYGLMLSGGTPSGRAAPTHPIESRQAAGSGKKVRDRSGGGASSKALGSMSGVLEPDGRGGEEESGLWMGLYTGERGRPERERTEGRCRTTAAKMQRGA